VLHDSSNDRQEAFFDGEPVNLKEFLKLETYHVTLRKEFQEPLIRS
jgi:hypothetical protein